MARVRLIRLAVGLLAPSLLLWNGAAAQNRPALPAPAVSLTTASELNATPGGHARLFISVQSAEPVPPNSFIRLRGLPKGALLNEGHAVAAGIWAVPLAALEQLIVQLPPEPIGRAEVSVALMTIDGAVLAERRMVIVGTEVPASRAPAPIPSPAPEPAPVPQPTAQQQPVPARAVPPRLPVPQAAPAQSTTPQPAPPQAASQTAPTAPPAKMSPEAAARAKVLVDRGREALQEGNVSGARLFFRHAADMGDANGAMALGATFDPVELKRIAAFGVRADPVAAAQWYKTAQSLGAPEAAERIKRLLGQ